MRFFFLLSLLLSVTLFADRIGNVEFHLPLEHRYWILDHQNKGKGNGKRESEVRIYRPENFEQTKSEEVFGAVSTDIPFGPNDLASLEKGIQTNFPKQKVKAHILEQTPHSVFLEWKVLDKKTEEEKIHGWTRGFGTKKGTVLLMYQTDQFDTLEKDSPAWIRTLQEAKIID